MGGLALGLSVKTYIASLNRREVRISEAGQAGQGLCNTGGYFTTTSGYHYCFLFKDSVSTYVQQIAECKAYGQLAKLTDGEIRQDILGIISQFNIEKQWLIDRVGPETGGPIIFDTCTNLTAKFPSTDTSLYYDGDCSATHMILDKLNGAGGRFNDLFIPSGAEIYGGLCQMTAIPSASPSPSSSPSPSPSPGANQAWFVIHKFLDVNRNSVREIGEGTTNRTWEFEYQIDGGEKESYMIEPGEEEGEKIIVNKGVKVKVSELGQEGWLNTTGAELTKTLSDPKLYTFYFGNWPVGGVGGASPAPPAGGFPPTQPDTGTPTVLTLSLALSIMVITIIKVILKV